jgi:4-hydroxybenzoate polyprenyltransferase
VRALLVFRPLNLVIVAALQLVTYHFLNFHHGDRSLLNPNIWLLILGSVCVTAAGYLFNDWFDRLADKHNKPGKLYINHWNKTAFWLVFILMNLIALFAFYLVNPLLITWFMIIIFLLVLYTLLLKKLPLIGNLTVSFIAAFSVYAVFLTFETQDRHLVVFYSALAALITYIREIIKDMEDVEGDRLAGYRTFPVLTGVYQAQSVVSMTTIFLIVAYSYLLWKWVFPQFAMPLRWVFVAYQVICVILPLISLLVLNIRASEKSDYSRLSKLAKYIMATGLFSMLFF